jgi:hypothetical protein
MNMAENPIESLGCMGNTDEEKAEGHGALTDIRL